MSKSGKYIQCMFVLYPESQQDVIAYVQQHFSCAWALHDKDVYEQDAPDGSYRTGDLKKPHVHFVCRFRNPRTFSGIAKELGVPVNTIRRCNDLYAAYVYLWHGDTPDKYQYDAQIVQTHEFDPPEKGSGSGKEEEAQVELLLEMPSFSSTREMARWAFENGCWATFKSSYGIWRDIRNEMRESELNASRWCYGDSRQNPDAPSFGESFVPVIKPDAPL